MTDASRPPGPVDPSRRIESIDMVRGFALFGVLLINMFNFGATSPVWAATLDRVAMSVARFLFETKSWRLFSFLFGLGFSLQFLRAQARGEHFIGTYARRLVILFVIGMGHALFYDGDILMLYAELGLLLTLFWKVPDRLLLILAFALLSVFPIGRAVTSLQNPDREVSTPVGDDLVAAQAALDDALQHRPYAVGSVTDVMRYNSQAIPANPLAYPLDAESGFAVFAMFLLGLYTGRRRIVEDVERHLPFIRQVFKWGLALGLLGMSIERILALGWGYQVFDEPIASIPLGALGDVAFAYGSTALCLGYAAAIVLASKRTRLRWIVRPLGPVGRLALTVYLTQSLMFTTLFYGYGLGLGYRIGPAAVFGIAVGFFGLQVLMCAWWVARFRFGPAEWLWRGLTYLSLPPLKR